MFVDVLGEEVMGDMICVLFVCEFFEMDGLVVCYGIGVCW